MIKDRLFLPPTHSTYFKKEIDPEKYSYLLEFIGVVSGIAE